MAEAFRWHNEPAVWRGDATALTLKTDVKTDFWQETFYGFHRDSGHAYLRPVTSDFTGSATINGAYRNSLRSGGADAAAGRA
ncbi:DUF1349 domain-containing protein [Rhizobium sp. RCAM05350]|nr:DUF1349 domain-containing protein [Rhizobium sp. RCAM05350]